MRSPTFVVGAFLLGGPIFLGAPSVSGQPLDAMTLATSSVNIQHIATGPGGQVLVTASDRGPTRVWIKGFVRKVLPGGRPVLSADGAILATAERFDDGTGQIWVWRLPAGEPLRRFDAPNVDLLSLSADGGFVATVGDRRTLRIFDVRSGQMHLELTGDRVPLNPQELILEPEGGWLAAAGWGTVVVWDWADGKRRHAFGVNKAKLKQATIERSSKLAATFSAGVGTLWRLDDGKRMSRLEGRWGQIQDIAISPRGDLIAATMAEVVQVWEVATGKGKYWLGGHHGSVPAIAWSPDGNWLATTGFHDKKIRLWNTATGVLKHEFEPGSFASAVAFSPDSTALAGGGGVAAQVWHSATAASIQPFMAYLKSIRDLEATPDGRWLISGEGRAVWLWSLAGTQPPTKLEGAGFLLSRDGTRLMIRDLSERWVRVWDLEKPALRCELRHDTPVTAYAWGWQDRVAITGSADGVVRFWDSETGKLLSELRGPVAPIDRLAVAAQGQRLLVADRNGDLRAWDLEADPPQAEVLLEGGPRLRRFELDPDGRWLVGSTLTEKSLWVRSTAALTETRTIDLEKQNLTDISGFSPGGSLLAVVKASRPKLALLDMHDFSVQTEMIGHHDTAGAISWSRDGRLLATGSSDHTARLWQADGRQLKVFDGHPSGVSATAIGPRGDWLASGDSEGVIRLWDVSNGAELVRLYPLQADTWAVLGLDGSWDASNDGRPRGIVVWEGAEIKPLAAFPEKRRPGLLAAVMARFPTTASAHERPEPASTAEPPLPPRVLSPADREPQPAPDGPKLRLLAKLAAQKKPTSLVRIVDDVAYVAGDALTVFDLADPRQPKLLGGLELPSWVHAMVLAERRLYLLLGTAIDVIDVANPRGPRRLGRVALRNYAVGLAVDGEVAWVATTTGLEAFDVSRPLEPRELGRYAACLPSRGRSRCQVKSLLLEGHRAWLEVENGDQPRLETVDLADPQRPRRSNRFPLPESARPVAAWAGRIALISKRGLTIARLDEAEKLITLGQLEMPAASAVEIVGDRAYVADSLLGLLIADVSDPENPKVIARFDPSAPAGSPMTTDLAMLGNDVVLVNSWRGLAIVHVEE